MKEPEFKEVYSVQELQGMERGLARSKLFCKEKNSDANDIPLDPELKKEIDELILRPFVDQSLKDFIPTPLLSYENEHAHKIAEARKTFQEYAKKMERGIQALRKACIWVESDESHPLLKIPEDPEAYQKMLDDGKPPQEILSISDEIMKRSYEEACKQYENRNYAEAANILEALLYLNPAHSIYWQLLGMIEHALGNLESAVENLVIGLQKGSSSLVPYVHVINSLVDLKRPDEAIEMIQTALKVENPVDADVSTIQGALRNLEQALTGK